MIATVTFPAPTMPADPPPDDPRPSSETGRIQADLMEMMREICFHTRDGRGKRLKVAQMIDNLLRPSVLREYAAFKARQAAESEDQPKRRKKGE